MPFMRSSFARAAPAALLLSALVTGCGLTPSKPVSYEPEAFGSTTTHTRRFPVSDSQTCEAARRALLSQGYMITAATPDTVAGHKSFQPAAEVHVEVEFRIVCARDIDGKDGSRSTVAFASALQDRYAIKKVNNSASVGVGVLGSVSLPYSSSDDALVKVASETLTDDRLYDRFFTLLERFLPEAAAGIPPEAQAAAAAAAKTVAPMGHVPPAPQPAPAAAPAAPVAPAPAPAAAPAAPAAAPASAPAPGAGAAQATQAVQPEPALAAPSAQALQPAQTSQPTQTAAPSPTAQPAPSAE